MSNSWGTKAAIELIIFMGITYTAVLLIVGSSGGLTWPSAAPGSPGADVPILNIFIGLFNFIWGFVSVLFTLFTFNIPGMPVEIRMILTPLYTGMGIFCIIVFWDKILLIVEIIVNIPAILYNYTIALVWGFTKLPYFHFHQGGSTT